MAVFLLLEGDFSASKKISDFLNLGIDFFLFRVYYIGVEKEWATVTGAEAKTTNKEEVIRMTNWYKILDVPEYLARHQIIRPDGSRFGFKWANCLVRYFEHEQGAMSVTYPAIFWLDNKWHSGEIEVGRDGSLLKRLTP